MLILESLLQEALSPITQLFKNLEKKNLNSEMLPATRAAEEKHTYTYATIFLPVRKKLRPKAVTPPARQPASGLQNSGPSRNSAGLPSVLQFAHELLLTLSRMDSGSCSHGERWNNPAQRRSIQKQQEKPNLSTYGPRPLRLPAFLPVYPQDISAGQAAFHALDT